MNADSALPRLPIEVIEPLCSTFSKQADWILNLYEMARGTSRHPGQCVSCFYALLGAASREKRLALEPLRRWIEQNLEIEVRAGEEEAGVLPVLLEEPDLESFCHQAMTRVREDAVIDAPRIALRFCFKRGRAA